MKCSKHNVELNVSSWRCRLCREEEDMLAYEKSFSFTRSTSEATFKKRLKCNDRYLHTVKVNNSLFSIKIPGCTQYTSVYPHKKY